MATSNILTPTVPLVKRVIFVSGPHLDPSPIIQKQTAKDGQTKTPIILTQDHLQNSRVLPADNDSNGDSVPDFHSNQYSDTQTIRETHHHKTIAAAIFQLNYEVSKMQKRIELLHQRLDTIEDSEGQRIKKKRRKAEEIQKNYQCPYDNCQKSYGTEVSLNLHIKLKHNGGTKTERQQFIRLKLAGHNVQPKISLPPEMLKSLQEVTSSK